MNFLLDTNVISEWAKARPNTGVVRWLAEADEDRTFTSPITIAEIRHGIGRLPMGGRRDRLDSWLTEDLATRFEGRILPVDWRIGDCWGRVMARGQAAGRPVSTMDGFIAATAEWHDMALVTRTHRISRRWAFG